MLGIVIMVLGRYRIVGYLDPASVSAKLLGQPSSEAALSRTTLGQFPPWQNNNFIQAGLGAWGFFV